MICHTFERQRKAMFQANGALVDELKTSGRRIKKLKERFAGNWDDILGARFDEQQLEELKKHTVPQSSARPRTLRQLH